MYHLYEVLVENPVMWMKVQASCGSEEQAVAIFGSRFGEEVPSANSPEYCLSAPFKLSERADWIFNWETIKANLPDGWDDYKFRLAAGPYAWCESLSDGCDCHGREGRLDALYCSDVGLNDDVARRAGKTSNVRYFAWRQQMGRDDANAGRYDEDRLQSYYAAVLEMVKASRDLEEEREEDCLYLVIRVDRNSPRGAGTITSVERDRTDPTGDTHHTSISRYSNWDVCLGIADGLMDLG